MAKLIAQTFFTMLSFLCRSNKACVFAQCRAGLHCSPDILDFGVFSAQFLVDSVWWLVGDTSWGDVCAEEQTRHLWKRRLLPRLDL
ncbi:unnamed protein product [Oncorhynchus mykiss]|uniref:Secreted protein n=1 Tax=Oncorhynchus mykiss TaxID=8022 RepID=A0A060YIW3_ONCMY|nr:unnamed protein product [Oncorhynchus mykiss]